MVVLAAAALLRGRKERTEEKLADVYKRQLYTLAGDAACVLPATIDTRAAVNAVNALEKIGRAHV